jgi:hypothetical protein
MADQLPLDLITPEMLADVTHNISAFLKHYGVPLHLPDRPIFDVDKNPSFALSRHDNEIIITVNFSLSITRRSLTLKLQLFGYQPMAKIYMHPTYKGCRATWLIR